MSSENQIRMRLPHSGFSGWRRWGSRIAALLLLVLMGSGSSFAYSVLTHEEIVDLVWATQLSPLLLKRFPTLTEDQLKEAHAYAYGGAVIQDLGYYPFGSAEFSNLVHYVRSGDFVRELLLQSQDANEYAFALGALAHYTSDIAGHPAVNRAVSIQYPKLRAKYGNSVRYAEDHTVSRMIPEMTKIALRTHKKDMMQETPNFAKRKFLYRLSRSDYEKEWGKDYKKDGFKTRLFSVLLRYMPKIGPFKALAFNNPTAQTEDLYFKSINTTVDQYRIFPEQVRTDSLILANCDFDTGKETKAAEYSLTDDTYAKLLGQLAGRKFDLTSPDLRENILNFYADLSLPLETKKDSARWQSVLTSLDQLKLIAPAPIVAGSPAAPR